MLASRCGLARGRPRVVTVLWMPLFTIHLTSYCQAFFLPVLFPFRYLCNFVSLRVMLNMGVIEETATRSLTFLFTPLKHHYDPRRYWRKRCLPHYSKLLAVAIFMGWSVEYNRKAIAVNSNQRPRGVRFDWISISQVQCSLLSPRFFPSLVLCSF